MSDNKKAASETQGFEAGAFDPYVVKDPEAIAVNVARALEQLGAAASAWLGARNDPAAPGADLFPLSDMVDTASKVASFWASDSKRSLEAQTQLLGGFLDLWMRSVRRAAGEPVEAERRRSSGRRFADEDWYRHPFFDFLRQAYLLMVEWLEKLVAQTEGLDAQTRHRAEFYTRQIMAALSPENFVLSNPKLFRDTVAESGQNLVRGMMMLKDDILENGGDFRIRHTDMNRFVLGRNIAATPGKVLAQNDLCQIIQYAPLTAKVLKPPLLICPPWINKYYVLDLSPETSLIRWCVEQGHTVFVISWINPDERHAEKSWYAYVDEGINFALDRIEQATGERRVNAVGYCVGGTLLATALALHAQTGDKRIKTATLLTAQVDFTHAGDLKIFVNEEQLAALEHHMSRKGYLEGSRMAMVFNMLRASELVWPYLVNAYLLGKEPMPFDLLFWNADATRMAAANHSFYLRRFYLENALSQGKMILKGRQLSLKDIKVPVYCLATRDDHIAPARSVFLGAGLFGGKVDFVLSGSGHIAGVVNPPSRGKYNYWADGRTGQDFDQWMTTAQAVEGSWWPHWHDWVTSKSKQRLAARHPGDGALRPIEDAPGSYVMMRS